MLFLLSFDIYIYIFFHFYLTASQRFLVCNVKNQTNNNKKTHNSPLFLHIFQGTNAKIEEQKLVFFFFGGGLIYFSVDLHFLECLTCLQ